MVTDEEEQRLPKPKIFIPIWISHLISRCFALLSLIIGKKFVLPFWGFTIMETYKVTKPYNLARFNAWYGQFYLNISSHSRVKYKFLLLKQLTPKMLHAKKGLKCNNSTTSYSLGFGFIQNHWNTLLLLMFWNGNTQLAAPPHSKFNSKLKKGFFLSRSARIISSRLTRPDSCWTTIQFRAVRRIGKWSRTLFVSSRILKNPTRKSSWKDSYANLLNYFVPCFPTPSFSFAQFISTSAFLDLT